MSGYCEVAQNRKKWPNQIVLILKEKKIKRFYLSRQVTQQGSVGVAKPDVTVHASNNKKKKSLKKIFSKK